MTEIVLPSNPNKIHELIISGICDSIAQHTAQQGGSRTIAAETFMKNVCYTCIFNIEQTKCNVSSKDLSSISGASKRQIQWARTKVTYLIGNHAIMAPLERAERREFIRVKLEPFLYSFLVDDNYTMLDTNQGLVEVRDSRSNENVFEHKRFC